MPAVRFTNEDLVRQVLTDLRVDYETEDGPAGAMEYAIRRATNRVLELLRDSTTSVDDLAVNETIQDKASDLAAFFLAGRGGQCNSAALKDRYADAVEYLESVGFGERQIPGLASSIGKGGAPVLSNFTIDMQARAPVRVVSTTSTGSPDGYPVNLDRTNQYQQQP
jgi:hypothetical protein